MDSKTKQRFISACDEVLLPLGFGRRKSEQEWTRTCASETRHLIHLNFGKAIVNPSVSVVFIDLERLKPPSGVCSVSERLSQCFQPPRTYSDEDPPDLVIQDLLTTGMSRLDSLEDRETVVSMLKEESLKSWPVVSLSHRIRLLPLLLAVLGHREEASIWIQNFSSDPNLRDQLLPSYKDFVQWFQKEFAA